jgi:hypothetical protein
LMEFLIFIPVTLYIQKNWRQQAPRIRCGFFMDYSAACQRFQRRFTRKLISYTKLKSRWWRF